MNINKKNDDKITAYFFSRPTFVSTFNILINTPNRTWGIK